MNPLKYTTANISLWSLRNS